MPITATSFQDKSIAIYIKVNATNVDLKVFGSPENLSFDQFEGEVVIDANINVNLERNFRLRNEVECRDQNVSGQWGPV
jgi:hypothetical protein